MSVVSDTVIYSLNGATQVRLTVHIGDDQVGGTSVMFEGQIFEIPGDGSRVFGDGSLSGKIVHCVTNVKDVNPETNQTSVVYTMEGGPSLMDYPYSTIVPKQGEWAEYIIDIVLF